MKDLLHKLNPRSLSLVRSIGVLAEAQKMKAYLVGGPVRDLLLNSSTNDLDITVESACKSSEFKGTGNIGMKLAECFAAGHKGARIVQYPAFKTASVHMPGGLLIDFATARKESYTRGGAFPSVKAAGIRDDLFRRDFTVNAMAVAINPKIWGKLIDPFRGRADLRSKRIRILHDKSFLDDPTRILRAARFKTRLGFKIEAKTLRSLKSAITMKVLETIRPQRYLKDLKKILKEAKSREMIKCLKSWNAYKAPPGQTAKAAGS